jgi:hypothetical protein
MVGKATPRDPIAGKQNGRRITPAAVVRTSVEEDKSCEYVPCRVDDPAGCWL